MRTLLFVILLLSSVRLSAHEVPIAFFNIDIEDTVMHLMIQFDVEDLDYAVSSFYGELITETRSQHTSSISKYVSSHFSISLNQRDITTTIQEIKRDGDHYFITVRSICLEDRIQSIEIKNECLIYEIEQHSNIIRLHQTGQDERGFRLHEGRISTKITL